jgi:DNA adenine methylase
MVKSPLIWFGGKGKVAHHITKHFPSHTCYVEPFGGAAHVIAHKSPVDCEVYNDIDETLVNFLLVANSRTDELAEACEAIPYSRALYEKWKREAPPKSDFDRAVRFFYINRSGIAKGNADEGYCTNTGWRHSNSTNTARAYNRAADNIRTFAKRMKDVMIDSRDFREIIRVYDAPHTLFYVDPPYIGREKYYAGNFSEQDHRDLAEMLCKAEGKVILSYYADPLLDELYPDWSRETFQAARQVVNGNNNKSEELLLMNFDNNQLTLF